MKRFIFFAVVILITVSATAQKYTTKTGKISFFSSAKLEDITADNHQVTAALDATTGDVAYVVLIKSFEFDKALMQEHFNDNYMHSDKYPKSTFTGKITNISEVNFSKNGSYGVNVEGKLTIHGVEKDVKQKAEVVVNGNKVTTKAKFLVALADYNIKNDKLQNIANEIEVTVATELTKQ